MNFGGTAHKKSDLWYYSFIIGAGFICDVCAITTISLLAVNILKLLF
jgi:hypothetical protein